MIKLFVSLWNNETPITWGFIFRYSVIIYGSLIAIFVAIFVYNKVKEIIEKKGKKRDKTVVREVTDCKEVEES